MEMTETLRSAIETKNISRIHSVFYTIAHEDPSFASGKYEETLRYVKNLNLNGLIEEHDGTDFAPQEEWNSDYWAAVASELQDNFSQERINHMIEVGKHVYGKKKPVTSESRKTFVEIEYKEEKKESLEADTEKISKNTYSNDNTANNSSEQRTKKKKNVSVDDIDMWLIVTGIILGIGLLVHLLKGKK